MNHCTAAFLLFSVLASYGCSSSDSNSAPNSGAWQGKVPEKAGVVTITDSAFWEEVSIFGQFYDVDEQDYRTLRRIHGVDLVLDSCNYWTNDEFLAVVEKSQQEISAGDKLSVFVENALSLEVHKVLDSDGGVEYEAESGGFPSGKLPSNSTLTIPGDDFPAFTTIDIPAVETFEGLNISENGVEVDLELVKKWAYVPSTETQIEWQASQVESSTSTVHISAYLYSGVGDDMQASLVVCNANDDGSFQFPDEAQEYFDGSSSSRLRVARQNTVIRSEENADLIITHDSEFLWF